MGRPEIRDTRQIEALGPRTKVNRARAERERSRSRRRVARIKKEQRKQQEYEKTRYESYRSPEESWDDTVYWAKNCYARFIKRAGRIINFESLRLRMERQEYSVLDIVKEMASPGKPRAWIVLEPGGGRRPLLNQGELRQICKKVGMPYYREMKTDEMRATLVILADMCGIDPRREMLEF